MANGSSKKRAGNNRPAQTTRAKAAPAKPAAAPAVQAGMDLYDKIVWYCLHALLIAVPLAMSNLTFLGIGNGLPLTYDQFDIAKVFVMRALTLVALGAWSWKMLMNGGRLRRTKLDWLVVAFLAWVALTTIFSIHWPTALFGKYRRFEGFISFFNYAVIFFLVVQMVDRPSRIRSLARSLFIGGVLVALYGVAQYIGADPIKWGALPFEANRSFSTYGNPDLLGGFLMFPLPIALGLALSEDSAVWRVVYWVGFFFLAIVWVTAFVRGAWIGGAVSLLILVAFAVWFYRRGDITLHPAVDGGAGGVILAALGFVVIKSSTTGSGVMNFADRVHSIFEFSGGSGLTRTEIWHAAIDAIKTRPILGFGADTFRLVFPKFKPLAYTKDAGYLSVADNVHDYPLQLATGIGVPGLLLLYIGVFGVALYVSLRGILAKVNGPARYLMVAIWAAAVGYITHLFFGLSVTGSTFLLWFCFGLLLAPFATTVEVEAPAWGTIASIAALAVIVAAFAYNVVYVRADNYYLKARIEQGDPTARVNDVKSAIALNPFNDMYRAELGLAYQDVMAYWLQQAQTQQGQSTALASAQDAFKNTEAALRDTIAFVPTEYDNYVFLANVYNQAGVYFNQPAYFDEALKVAQTAMKDVEPYGPAIRFQAGVSYQYKGDIPDAIKTLEAASAMDPNYADPQLLLGELYRREGDLATAKKWYTSGGAVSTGYQAQQASQALQSIEASMKAKGSAPATK